MAELSSKEHAEIACQCIDDLLKDLQADKWTFRNNCELRKRISEHVQALGIAPPFPGTELTETASETDEWLTIHDPVMKSTEHRIILTIPKPQGPPQYLPMTRDRILAVLA